MANRKPSAQEWQRKYNKVVAELKDHHAAKAGYDAVVAERDKLRQELAEAGTRHKQDQERIARLQHEEHITGRQIEALEETVAARTQGILDLRKQRTNDLAAYEKNMAEAVGRFETKRAALNAAQAKIEELKAELMPARHRVNHLLPFEKAVQNMAHEAPRIVRQFNSPAKSQEATIKRALRAIDHWVKNTPKEKTLRIRAAGKQSIHATNGEMKPMCGAKVGEDFFLVGDDPTCANCKKMLGV